MKKILFPILTVFVLFIGFTIFTRETCACLKPSDFIEMNLMALRDEMRETGSDFSEVCSSTMIKTTFDRLNSEYHVEPLCQSDKNNFTLQVKMRNYKTLCVDLDSTAEGYTLKKGAVTCN